ncbi:hypothetical protein ABZY45_14015 [Streptomyces sp. NPDC006516]
MTWTITWTAPALNDGGRFTETRVTQFTADVGPGLLSLTHGAK